ncbi:spermidine synthase [archaeon]|nr:spermidine synthase [archaeon]|tara:strand:- start:529 stop:1431 length:903 start_codon:yes stop_codon:yes gene_type:complete
MKEIKEFHMPSFGFFIIPKEKIIEKKTKFQRLEIFEHDFYGKVLRLDGYFQTSEFDEFLYHESLVQFPLFAHPNPKNVLIIGGGDGGALEEVTKHKDIENIIMVELDKEVIEFSKKYLTEINKNSFDDKRVTLRIEDGINFLENTKETFDVIILDLTDPSGESRKLYTKEFYELISRRLNKNGILSLHTEAYIHYPKIFSRILSTLKSVFKYIGNHSTFIPIYGTSLSFGLCSNDINFNKIDNETLNKRFRRRNVSDLKYLSSEIFKSALIEPKYIKDIMKTDTRISTLDNPIEEVDKNE